MRAFVDSNIFIYAAQAHRKFGGGSIKIVKDIERGKLEAYTTSLNLAEVAEVIHRYDSKETALKTVELLLALSMEVLPVGKEHLIMAEEIFSRYKINFFDCVYIAVMKERFIDTIITNDRHFDNITGINVIKPSEY
jgi:predicted nucleic acid-binding protein